MIEKIFRKVMRYDGITITDTVGYDRITLNVVSCDRSGDNAVRYKKCNLYALLSLQRKNDISIDVF